MHMLAAGMHAENVAEGTKDLDMRVGSTLLGPLAPVLLGSVAMHHKHIPAEAFQEGVKILKWLIAQAERTQRRVQTVYLPRLKTGWPALWPCRAALSQLGRLESEFWDQVFCALVVGCKRARHGIVACADLIRPDIVALRPMVLVLRKNDPAQ